MNLTHRYSVRDGESRATESPILVKERTFTSKKADRVRRERKFQRNVSDPVPTKTSASIEEIWRCEREFNDERPMNKITIAKNLLTDENQ